MTDAKSDKAFIVSRDAPIIQGGVFEYTGLDSGLRISFYIFNQFDTDPILHWQMSQ